MRRLAPLFLVALCGCMSGAGFVPPPPEIPHTLVEALQVRLDQWSPVPLPVPPPVPFLPPGPPEPARPIYFCGNETPGSAGVVLLDAGTSLRIICIRPACSPDQDDTYTVRITSGPFQGRTFRMPLLRESRLTGIRRLLTRHGSRSSAPTRPSNGIDTGT